MLDWTLQNVGYSKDTIKELQKGIYQLDITIYGYNGDLKQVLDDDIDDFLDKNGTENDAIAIYDTNKDVVHISDKKTIDEFETDIPAIEQELLDNLHTNW